VYVSVDWFMFDSAALFWLLLGIMGLIAACLLLMAYEMARRDRGGRTREPARAAKECAYFFGFLSKYPFDKPIPNECFGCVLALSCIKAVEPVGAEAVAVKKVEAASVQH
jgi:hypothetical protein